MGTEAAFLRRRGVGGWVRVVEGVLWGGRGGGGGCEVLVGGSCGLGVWLVGLLVMGGFCQLVRCGLGGTLVVRIEPCF